MGQPVDQRPDPFGRGVERAGSEGRLKLRRQDHRQAGRHRLGNAIAKSLDPAAAVVIDISVERCEKIRDPLCPKAQKRDLGPRTQHPHPHLGPVGIGKAGLVTRVGELGKVRARMATDDDA